MSIAERKEREREQRRNDILSAAEKLFFARGYDSVTMDDIAKEVELNKATIYLYYKDKESLFFTVVLQGVRILDGMVREREVNAKTGSDKLWEIGRAYISFAEKYPDYNRAYNYFYSGRFDLASLTNTEEMNHSMLSMLDSGPKFWKNIGFAANRASSEVAEQIVGLNHEIFALMSAAIKAGIGEGAFRPDLDPVETAAVFTLLLESVPRMRPDLAKVLEAQGIDQPGFAKDIGDLMCHMLTNKQKGKKTGP
jgi:TetR/AcrR family transcriptional regulator